MKNLIYAFMFTIVAIFSQLGTNRTEAKEIRDYRLSPVALKELFDKSPYASLTSLSGKTMIGVCKVYQTLPPTDLVLPNISVLDIQPAKCANPGTAATCTPGEPRFALLTLAGSADWIDDAAAAAHQTYEDLLRKGTDEWTAYVNEGGSQFGQDSMSDGERIKSVSLQTYKTWEPIVYNLPSLHQDKAITYYTEPNYGQNKTFILAQLHVKQVKPGEYVSALKEIFDAESFTPLTAAQQFEQMGFEIPVSNQRTLGTFCYWFTEYKSKMK